ncbi:MAG: hypothetical protein HY896_08910 [Deltaproteobacteria bacterium]|nr:hypothetical protein [Deltaproteobacteria bacterium]
MMKGAAVPEFRLTFSAVVASPVPMARWAFLSLVLLSMFGMAAWNPCLAAEKAFEVTPKWIRPGPDAVVRVNLGGKLDVIKKNKLFLRLTLPNNTVKDFALDREQVRRGVAEARISDHMRRGTYKSELVDEDGKVLARGPEDIRVRGTEKPSIAAVMPGVCYPSEGRFDFELVGNDFAQYKAEELDVWINDAKVLFEKRLNDKKGGMSETACDGKYPCLIWNWRTLRIYGLSLDRQSFLDNVSVHRPFVVSVEGDQEISEPKRLVLSCVQYYWPRLGAFGILSLFIGTVYFFSRERVEHYRRSHRNSGTLTFLLIDNQTNTYSLSKFQLILWAAAAIVAYSYLALSQSLVQGNWALPRVPDGLPTLLGLSATTTAVAVGATGFRGSKGAGPIHPGIGDFLTTGGVFAPERLQFFLWTILGVAGFVAGTLVQDPATVTKMPEIPENFNQLMGASSIGYLAGKFARKPGPVIKDFDCEPKRFAVDRPPNEIRIIGENLSPRAEVRIYGHPLPADRVKPAERPPEGKEFVSELIVIPKEAERQVAGAAVIRVINPDGQSAESNGT